MNPGSVIRFWGSVRDAARAIGVSPQAVYKWLDDGRVPKLREFQIRALMAQRK